MILWIFTAVTSVAGLFALVLALYIIRKLRSTAVGRMLFLALVCLAASALTHMVAAVYFALRGYGQEVAIPLLMSSVFLALSALSAYRFVSV